MKFAEWFERNARRPLQVLILIFVVVWFGLTAYSIHRTEEARRTSFDRLMNVSSLALSQRNRVLIESLLESAQTQIGVDSAAICLDGKIILASRSFANSCTLDSGVFFDSMSAPIPGFEGYHLVTHFSRLKDAGLQLFLLITSMSLLVLAVYLARRIQRKFETDLLQPLKIGLFGDDVLSMKEFEEMRQAYLRAKDAAASLAVAEALHRRNEQVAHDVRSPLSALTMLSSSFHTLPGDVGTVVRSSVKRLNEIAESLLKKEARASGKAHNIVPLVANLLAEKRVEHSCRNIEIIDSFEGSLEIQTDFDFTELSRIVSNLINNSVEASADGTKVQIGLRKYSDSFGVIVSDSGKGMPADVLARIGERGFSFGKSGNGLGVAHAKESIEQAGGKFNIQSKENVGTTVVIEIPTTSASPPSCR